MKNNFEQAYNYINANYTKSEICNILKENDDVKKAAAILQIKKLDKNLSKLLIFHLTNQTGQIRELCAYKINEMINEASENFQDENTLNTIIASLNDVNPNVVRFMLGTLKYVENKNYIFENLLNKIKELHNEITNKQRRGKLEEHIFTKKCFKIYWSLEGIKTLLKYEPKLADNNDFNYLIEDLSNFEEYTIREKVAQIVNMLPKFEKSDIKIKLMYDENYFVKRQI